LYNFSLNNFKDQEIDAFINEIENIDTKEKQVFMTKKSDVTESNDGSTYLTKNERENLSGLIFNEIKLRLKKDDNKGKIFQYFLGDENRTIKITKNFMQKLKIRTNNHSLTQAIYCLIVIAHTSLKSYDYKKLVKDVKDFKNISRNSAKKHVLKYIKTLEIKEKIDLSNWLPEERHKPILEEIACWIDLLKKYGNLQKVRRFLEKEERYVPQARTMTKYVIKSIGYEKYQKLLNKKVDWVARTPYKELQELAKIIGKEKTEVEGKLITKENDYNNIPYPDAAFLDWYCNRCDGIFKQTPHQVKKGSWCDKCVKELQRLKMILPIDLVREAAKEVGIEKTGYEGKFLADEEEYYKKRDTPPIHTLFWWECGKCDFRWQTTPDKVVNRKQWCPYCSQGFYERICRGCMEHIFSYLMKKEILFPQTSLEQVINLSSGISALKNYNPELIDFNITNMHLDGYNPELRIGFERNGRQHYERVFEWHPNEEDFEKQLKIDIFKKKVCKDNGIFLIIVGWEIREDEQYRIEPEEMQDYIIEQIEEVYGKNLPKIPKFDYKEFIRNKLTKSHELNKESHNNHKFLYLTEIQKRVLSEFQNKNLFFSDLDKMPHLKDLKYINSTIIDLYKKKYLTRIHVINPNATGTRKKQFKYSITSLGIKILELSSL